MPLPRRSLLLAVAPVVLAAASVVAPAGPAHAATESVTGELVRAWPEAAPGDDDAAGAPLSWVATASGESVRVPTEALADVPAGSTVDVTVGAPVADAATASGAEPARDVLASDVVVPAGTAAASDGAPPPGDLTDAVTVVLAAPAGSAPDGTTADALAAVVDGPVADFWRGQSDGAIRVGVTARYGWTATAAPCSRPTDMWTQAAAAIGFQPGPGRHLLLYVPPGDQAGCSYGLAEVGSGPGDGGRLYVRDLRPSLVAHELGHNWGLGHSAAEQCDGAVDTGDCSTDAYGDLYDVMGASWDRVGALTAAQAARLGLLAGDAVVPASGDGSVTLHPLAGGTGARAVRFTGTDGADYWVEYRAPVGQDRWLGTSDDVYRLGAGVLVHRAGGQPSTSVLLDGTPSPRARWARDRQAGLPVGESVSVGGVRLTVTAETPDAATVALAGLPVAAAGSASAAGATAPSVLPAQGAGQASAADPGHRRTATTTPAGTAATAGRVATPSAPSAPSAPSVPSEPSAPAADGAATAEPEGTAPPQSPAALATASSSTASSVLPAALGALGALAALAGGTAVLRRRVRPRG